jgi:hypothetical protein
MAREAPGESKQAYIIALVFFVLITIILGVTTWMGYSGQKQLEADKKKAEENAKAISDERDSQKAQLAALKLAVGIRDVKPEDLLGNPKKADGDTLVKTWLGKLITWDENQGKPQRSVMEELTTARELARQLQGNMQGSEAKAQEEAKRYEELLNAERAKTARQGQDIVRLQAQVKEERDSHTNAFQEQSNLNASQRDRIQKLNRDSQEEKDQSERAIKKLSDKNTDLQKNFDRLAKKASKTEDYVAYEKPLGKIAAIDQHGTYAFINLGTADNVKPQLTFSVFSGTDSYRAGQEPKASLELIRAIGPHESEVRISNVREPGRDPVMRGDLIYNPAWSPTLKQHIALAGVIDITGDGTDSAAEVVRNLRKQNIVVDAYLDLRDATVHGEITRETNYLVMGTTPSLDATAGIEQAASINEKKRDISQRMHEMEDTARLKGVATLPARRFLLLTGYPMPRTVAQPDYVPSQIKEEPQAPGARTPAGGGDAGKPRPAPKGNDEDADGAAPPPRRGKPAKGPGKNQPMNDDDKE